MERELDACSANCGQNCKIHEPANSFQKALLETNGKNSIGVFSHGFKSRRTREMLTRILQIEKRAFLAQSRNFRPSLDRHRRNL